MSPLLVLSAREQVVLQVGNVHSTDRGIEAPSSAILYKQVPFLILFHHNVQVMLMTQQDETHISLNHLNSLPYTKEHYIHTEHVNVSPPHILHFAFKLLQAISSIVQVQEASLDRRQGTTLCRT